MSWCQVEILKNITIKFNYKDKFYVKLFTNYITHNRLRNIETITDLCTSDLYNKRLK